MGQLYGSLKWSRFHYYVVYTHPITNNFSKIDLLQQNFDQVSCLEWKILRVLSFQLIDANFTSMEKCNWILNNPIACFPAASKYVFSWQIYFWIYHLIILVFLHVLLTCDKWAIVKRAGMEIFFKIVKGAGPIKQAGQINWAGPFKLASNKPAL